MTFGKVDTVFPLYCAGLPGLIRAPPAMRLSACPTCWLRVPHSPVPNYRQMLVKTAMTSSQRSWVRRYPVLFGKRPCIRRTMVHLSIRQGKWKLELCAGSGGRSSPTRKEAATMNLPQVQLYDLDRDIGETTNVWAAYPRVVEKLTSLLEQYKEEGRSVKR